MLRLRSHSITFIVLLFVALALFVADQGGTLAPPKDLAQRSLSPLERALAALNDEIDEVVATAGDLRSLRRENEQLRARLEELTLANVQRVESEKENELLRELLDFKRDNPNYTLLVGQIVAKERPAHITGYDPANLMQAMRIDQGSQDGIALGMPVVTARGLVGRIADVGANWSKVLLVLDESSAVSAFVQESRATGIVEGQGNGLVMRYIPHDQSIQPGDVIMTSGLGGKLPKGLVIGTVEEVSRHDVNPYQEATVRSPVDFNQLEFVFVVKAFQPDPSLGDETP